MFISALLLCTKQSNRKNERKKSFKSNLEMKKKVNFEKQFFKK